MSQYANCLDVIFLFIAVNDLTVALTEYLKMLLGLGYLWAILNIQESEFYYNISQTI